MNGNTQPTTCHTPIVLVAIEPKLGPNPPVYAVCWAKYPTWYTRQPKTMQTPTFLVEIIPDLSITTTPHGPDCKKECMVNVKWLAFKMQLNLLHRSVPPPLQLIERPAVWGHCMCNITPAFRLNRSCKACQLRPGSKEPHKANESPTKPIV